MFLQVWTLEFSLKNDLLGVLPIWAMFPQLSFWGEKSIRKIASAIGKSMMTDKCTTTKLRVSYAKVLIEVDITREMKDYIVIKDPKGNKIMQQVEYEWKPPLCTTCQKVGRECKKKVKLGRKQQELSKQVWMEKIENVMQQETISTEKIQRGNKEDCVGP